MAVFNKNNVALSAATDILPSELTREILSCLDLKHLHRCKCVCKSWYNLIRIEFLIIDIFLRLPVQSLLRFKSISKYCNNLTSDQYFIKFHHKYQASLNPSVIQIDERTMRSDHRMYSARLNPSLNNDHHVRAHDYPGFLSFLGSCNGLLCLCLNIVYRVPHPTTYVVHNPATRVFSMVPPYPSDWFSSVGFGYDCKSDDYKILAFGSNGVFIYSLRGNSWMKTQRPPSYDSRVSSPPYVYRSRHMAFLNNSLHWIDGGRIMSYELASEQYHKLPMPPLKTKHRDRGWGWDWDWDWDLDQIELSAPGGSHLHLLHQTTQERMELWILKESDVKHDWTWTKLFSLTDEGFDVNQWDAPSPLTYVNGGSKILLGSTLKPQEIVDFMSYEFKTKKLERVRIFDGAPEYFRADYDYLPNEPRPIVAFEWAESLFPLRRSNINDMLP